ncbi:MAG: RnfH family protein [Candidatus Malihini olakiniferum]
MLEISVDVVYALPERQYVRSVIMKEGATVKQAIITSGLLTLRADIDLQTNKVGIFGRSVRLIEEVEQGDRIEIYRSLIADPKELRRQRAMRFKIKHAYEYHSDKKACYQAKC